MTRWLWHPTRLVIILAVALTAAVPALRGEFAWNVRALARAIPHWPKSPYARYVAGWTPVWSPTPRETEAALGANPVDVQLLTALAAPYDGRYDTPVAREALARALRQAPGDPVVLSVAGMRDLRTATNALAYSREEERRPPRGEQRERDSAPGRPPEVHAPPAGPGAAAEEEERLLTAEEIAEPLKALDAWAAVDRDNAAPHAFAVCLLLGAKRDEEALARAEAAASKRIFTTYYPDLIRARSHAAQVQGVPAGDAAFTTLLTLLPEWAPLRDSARVMNAIGWDHFDAGDTETAFRYWLATARTGRLLARQERTTMIPRLVGVSVTAIGYAPIYKWTRDPEQEGRFDAGEFLPQEAYRPFVAAHGELAARRVYDELASGESLRRETRAAAPVVWDSFLRAHCVYAAARTLALLALPAAILAALLCLVASAIGGDLSPRLDRLWSAILVVAVVVAPLAMAVGSRVEALHLWEGYWYSDEVGLAVTPHALAAGAPAALAGVIALAAAWAARRRGIAYGPAFLGGLRQSMATALAVLAVMWVGATAVAVHEGAFASRFIARVAEVGELQALQELTSGK